MSLSRGDFLKQLGELFSPNAPQGTNIHMPKGFRLPDQPRPGAHLLPLAQPVLNGMATTVNENNHVFSLLKQPQNN